CTRGPSAETRPPGLVSHSLLPFDFTWRTGRRLATIIKPPVRDDSLRLECGRGCRSLRLRCGATSATGAAESEDKVDCAITLLNAVGRDRLLSRATPHCSGACIELRAVPKALHLPTYHNTASKRSATMGAAVLKRDITVVSSAEHNALLPDAQ